MRCKLAKRGWAVTFSPQEVLTQSIRSTIQTSILTMVLLSILLTTVPVKAVPFESEQDFDVNAYLDYWGRRTTTQKSNPFLFNSNVNTNNQPAYNSQGAGRSQSSQGVSRPSYSSSNDRSDSDRIYFADQDNTRIRKQPTRTQGYDYTRPQTSTDSFRYDDYEGRPFSTREDRSPHIISASNNPGSLTNTFINQRPKDTSYDLSTSSANNFRDNRANEPVRNTGRESSSNINQPSRDQSNTNREDTFRGNDDRNNNNRISVQMCEEYKKYSKKKIVFAPLLVDPTPIEKEIPQCDITSQLIVGGVVAKLNEFPHMAALGYESQDGMQWKCGGTLISENFVLTAAHCVKTSDTPPSVVRLGEKNLNSKSDGANPIDLKIVETLVHEDYTRSAHYNDIALLRLERSVTFDAKIRPACLWQTYDIKSQKATATGWGTTDFIEFSGSDNLLKVDLSLYNNAKCNSYYESNRRLPFGITQSQLCAGAPNSERDTCQGDSGGPLTVIGSENRCMYYLVGVTSFGKFCGGEAPGVYTRVSSYLDWIEERVWLRQSRSQRSQSQRSQSQRSQSQRYT